MRTTGCLVFLIISLSSLARDPYSRNESIDILHYQFKLELGDSSNFIKGEASLTIRVIKPMTEFELDFTEKNAFGSGMTTAQVMFLGKALEFAHHNGRLKIILPEIAAAGNRLLVTVRYSGIPTDGLVIGKNRFGERTFFGDNWPDRAHHWLPVIDHPYDKATCEFIVTAPAHYQVIGNGEKIEESYLLNGKKRTHWVESAPIATKVMVIGVAHFAIQKAGTVQGVPVESWVYPQDRDAGFRDYLHSVSMLDFFSQHIGPYPYEKLANVQSTTRYGGMENASAIFYAENSVTGKNEYESTVAHEIAHQWFGNSASENDWHHVWLSEGFATYFSHLYKEFTYGRDALVAEMKADRATAIAFDRINQAPIVDTTVTVLMNLLDAHSYQKAGWVLHMLRTEVGDEAFWQGIRSYYKTYRDSNALTDDFRRIMEEASGKDLRPFFRQWLWAGGHPTISGTWTYRGAQHVVDLVVSQDQTGFPFQAPLEIGLVGRDGRVVIRSVQLAGKTQKFSISAETEVEKLILDPRTLLFFEGTLKPR